MTDPTTIAPDQVVTNRDGTATVAWGETPVHVDPETGLPLGDETFVPAWRIKRPTVRVLRYLMELWHSSINARKDEQLAMNEHARSIQQAIRDGIDVSNEDIEAVSNAAKEMIRSTERVAWPWWLEMVRLLGTPVGSFPREPTEDDAPPWLVQNAAVYTLLTQHWQTVPLVPGAGPPLTGSQPQPQVPMTR